ncbi:aminodeoxychorismate synthase component I [Rhodococcus fascians]|jgi:para-aminobenzoate synthetase|uniref:aminodeoxychorismate synthase component I n=1 Tax=Nocardiaceae TaxID=85025 RepID=UPI00050C0357|nr:MULTISPECIES: aminodeoxychorismate synthase component I [Rhodococcus]MBJ7323989.1 aminodeoxychorismate synthase component I [Rhodococcus sp. (in: high G+C Gram-positive bacteria)]MDJ0426603.1 aminodeoxychorismate synthase component I [Rhodococcus fascians]MDJ0468885.1 aminodeoxychorismate synthase component I [Rhodococcus fascians]
MTIRTLLVDNYDSFTYNLYSLLAEVNGRPPTVVKNDVAWSSLDFAAFDNVVISPGPGRPDVEQDFGISGRVISESGLPILGVCLGHQGMCHLFGGEVDLAPAPMHGRTTDITHTGVDLFEGIPSPYSVVRYHSLVVTRTPADFEEVAWTPDGLVMAVRHHSKPLWGVQFHPESISTEYGRELLANFRDLTLARSSAANAAGTHDSMFTIETRTIDSDFDSERVFQTLFAHDTKSFWLDGSAALEPECRFTVMGDCSGPHAEYVTYSVAETMVTVEGSDGTKEHIHSTFFDYIDAQLRRRATPPRHDLPFAFGLGYVGYLGYELKADTGGQLVHTSATPDASMVFSDRALVFDHEAGTLYLMGLADTPGDPVLAQWFDSVTATLSGLSEKAQTVSAPSGIPASGAPLLGAELSLEPRLRHDRTHYLDLISQCLAEIRSGETYEVCLTNTATVAGSIDPAATYSYMREINPTPYSAFLNFPDVSVLSASPERFLRIDADRIVESKPIKGTRPRGATPEEDNALKADLVANEKDKAENLMIVDLVRNDLAQVCVPGSVHVPKLFDVETYAPVHQLVSTVRGRLRDDASAADCIRAAFPGGSMTGAPKIRTMAIIDKLEDGPRGVYSGAIGYFSITGTADFSIVIRTIVATEHEVTYGVGGAIVALSDPDEEFEETMVKAVSMRRALTGRTANSG